LSRKKDKLELFEVAICNLKLTIWSEVLKKRRKVLAVMKYADYFYGCVGGQIENRVEEMGKCSAA
jgi:hypothetical protein